MFDTLPVFFNLDLSLLYVELEMHLYQAQGPYLTFTVLLRVLQFSIHIFSDICPKENGFPIVLSGSI